MRNRCHSRALPPALSRWVQSIVSLSAHPEEEAEALARATTSDAVGSTPFHDTTSVTRKNEVPHAVEADGTTTCPPSTVGDEKKGDVWGGVFPPTATAGGGGEERTTASVVRRLSPSSGVPLAWEREEEKENGGDVNEVAHHEGNASSHVVPLSPSIEEEKKKIDEEEETTKATPMWSLFPFLSAPPQFLDGLPFFPSLLRGDLGEAVVMDVVLRLPFHIQPHPPQPKPSWKVEGSGTNARGWGTSDGPPEEHPGYTHVSHGISLVRQPQAFQFVLDTLTRKSLTTIPAAPSMMTARTTPMTTSAASSFLSTSASHSGADISNTVEVDAEQLLASLQVFLLPFRHRTTEGNPGARQEPDMPRQTEASSRRSDAEGKEEEDAAAAWMPREGNLPCATRRSEEKEIPIPNERAALLSSLTSSSSSRQHTSIFVLSNTSVLPLLVQLFASVAVQKIVSRLRPLCQLLFLYLGTDRVVLERVVDVEAGYTVACKSAPWLSALHGSRRHTTRSATAPTTKRQREPPEGADESVEPSAHARNDAKKTPVMMRSPTPGGADDANHFKGRRASKAKMEEEEKRIPHTKKTTLKTETKHLQREKKKRLQTIAEDEKEDPFLSSSSSSSRSSSSSSSSSNTRTSHRHAPSRHSLGPVAFPPSAVFARSHRKEEENEAARAEGSDSPPPSGALGHFPNFPSLWARISLDARMALVSAMERMQLPHALPFPPPPPLPRSVLVHRRGGGNGGRHRGEERKMAPTSLSGTGREGMAGPRSPSPPPPPLRATSLERESSLPTLSGDALLDQAEQFLSTLSRRAGGPPPPTLPFLPPPPDTSAATVVDPFLPPSRPTTTSTHRPGIPPRRPQARVAVAWGIDGDARQPPSPVGRAAHPVTPPPARMGSEAAKSLPVDSNAGSSIALLLPPSPSSSPPPPPMPFESYYYFSPVVQQEIALPLGILAVFYLERVRPLADIPLLSLQEQRQSSSSSPSFPSLSSRRPLKTLLDVGLRRSYTLFLCELLSFHGVHLSSTLWSEMDQCLSRQRYVLSTVGQQWLDAFRTSSPPPEPEKTMVPHRREEGERGDVPPHEIPPPRRRAAVGRPSQETFELLDASEVLGWVEHLLTTIATTASLSPSSDDREGEMKKETDPLSSSSSSSSVWAELPWLQGVLSFLRRLRESHRCTAALQRRALDYLCDTIHTYLSTIPTSPSPPPTTLLTPSPLSFSSLHAGLSAAMEYMTLWLALRERWQCQERLCAIVEKYPLRKQQLRAAIGDAPSERDGGSWPASSSLHRSPAVPQHGGASQEGQRTRSRLVYTLYSTHPHWELHTATSNRIFSSRPNLQTLDRHPLLARYPLTPAAWRAYTQHWPLSTAPREEEAKAGGDGPPPLPVVRENAPSSSPPFLFPPLPPSFTWCHLYVPPPGAVFIALDYNQVELRLLAHLSGDPGLIDAFCRQDDVLTSIAEELLRCVPQVSHEYPSSSSSLAIPITTTTTAATVEEVARRRTAVKVVIYGLIYGMGKQKMEQAVRKVWEVGSKRTVPDGVPRTEDPTTTPTFEDDDETKKEKEDGGGRALTEVPSTKDGTSTRLSDAVPCSAAQFVERLTWKYPRMMAYLRHTRAEARFQKSVRTLSGRQFLDVTEDESEGEGEDEAEEEEEEHVEKGESPATSPVSQRTMPRTRPLSSSSSHLLHPSWRHSSRDRPNARTKAVVVHPNPFKRQQRAVALAIQGSASEILQGAMESIHRERHTYLPYLPMSPLVWSMVLHDEIIFAAPAAAVSVLIAPLKKTMEAQAGVFDLCVPLQVKARVGTSLGDMQEMTV